MRAIPLVLAVLLAATAAVPVAAQDDAATLERRLRACLVSGSAGAPRDSLLNAVVAVRSLCHTQINRVRDLRLETIDGSFGLPGARLSPAQQDERAQARDLETQRLNDEIARAIATFTGLTE